jgi:SAM-dependent methyltransferase
MSTSVAEPRLAPAARQNIVENRQFWATYAWPKGGDEWSNAYSGTRSMWDRLLRPRIAGYLPADHILEIAPGHGRCTQFLLPQCRRMTLVDLVPECIDACRARFGNSPNITYAVNDGCTLAMVADASVDFAFSWDSLVHVERDAACSYARELGRVLRAGGHAFVHHSNLGAYPERQRDFDWARDLHGRGRHMSAQAWREACADAGLHCLSQELLPWGSSGLYIDCVSLVRRSDEPAPATVVEEHTGWRAEAAHCRRLARLYPEPGAPALRDATE